MLNLRVSGKTAMLVRLEKTNHIKRQNRFYVLSISRTLFDEYTLSREWGRIGTSGGQRLVQFMQSFDEAFAALQDIKKLKQRRGYATIPVQLLLFPEIN